MVTRQYAYAKGVQLNSMIVIHYFEHKVVLLDVGVEGDHGKYKCGES